MVLDANLFTLVLTPSKSSLGAVDLVDPQGEVHYRKRLVSAQPVYEMSISDPLTDALLCTVKGTSPAAKMKTIELFNPNVTVSFQSTGTLSFKWTFQWEENEFEWKKEACYLIRKPDPPVIVCSCDAPQTSKRSALQILDYNLQRFDIEDRKGLEICIIACLLTFYDMQDDAVRQKSSESRPPLLGVPRTSASASGSPPTSGPPVPSKPARLTPQPSSDSLSLSSLHDALPPTPPPPPAPIPRDGNEIFILPDVPLSDYVQQCAQLLRDPSILFILLRAESEQTVAKCVQVAEATKRYIHRVRAEEGEEEEEVWQYVVADEKAGGKGRRGRINLDGPGPKDGKHDYQPPGPPKSLTIHLSKIPMPELQPKAAPKPSRASPVQPSHAPVGRKSPPSPKRFLHKDAKGKGRAEADEGEWEQWPEEEETKKDKGKGRASPPPPAPNPRVDKGKGKERPISMFSPFSSSSPPDLKPDKGKGRADDPDRKGQHRPSPSVPQLRVDTNGRPAPAPLQQRPQSYQPPPSAPQPSQQQQQAYRPPAAQGQPYGYPPQGPNGAYLQPANGPYGPGQAPYPVYRPPNGPPGGQGAYLSPYGPPPGQPVQQSGGGLSVFDKLFRPKSR